MPRTFFAAALMCFGVANLSFGAPPAKALLKLHTEEAASYGMFLDEAHTQPLDFQPTPIFSWTNIARDEGQFGHLFVWTRDGRPEVLGTIFSTPPMEPKGSRRRLVIHEFHTLSTAKLWPVTPKSSRYQFQPKTGIVLSPLADAPAVSESPAARLTQMRQIARSFSAESVSQQGERWELRVLPQPAMRYQPARGDVRDGGLFLFVTSAGTDPEVVLVIEARRTTAGGYQWHTAALRFSDRDLVVRDAMHVVFSSLDDPRLKISIENQYTLLRNLDQTYMCYRARDIDELPDETP